MRISLVLICFVFTGMIMGQTDLEKVKTEFTNFNYKDVLKDADEILKNETSLDTSDIIELYRMKAISHYSILQDKEAEKSFRHILDIDTSFTLDVRENSPKIVEFFNGIKDNYIAGVLRITEEKKLLKPDTVFVTKEVNIPPHMEPVEKKIIRSIVFPGWGHLYSGDKEKGLILSLLSAASIISSAYFVYDATIKGNRYSNETEVSKIGTRYNEYNKAYQLRNVSLFSFAAIWIYSQLDLLYFKADLRSGSNSLSLKLYF